ncbi:MAG: Spy/CpxP family protein refolding chaperone [Candidatus Aceula meridiana]|nr:Spy/CpxP family protein refolding chaperone [Candidatus Aceula meridiana]
MKKVALLTVLGLFLFSQLAYAGWGEKEGSHEKNKGKHHENFIQSLNLTPEQQQALKEHRQQTKQKRKEIQSAVKQKKEELKAMLQDPNFDEAQARQISGEIQAFKGQLSDLRIDGVSYLRSVLTPEQYVQFSEKMKKARHDRKGKKGGRRKFSGAEEEESDRP